MTLRARITLAATCAIAVAVAGTSVATFALVSSELTGRIDRSLRSRAAHLAADIAARGVPARTTRSSRRPGPGEGSVAARLVAASGSTVVIEGDPHAFGAATSPGGVSGVRAGALTTVRRDGIRYRVLATAVAGGRVLELARPLDEVDAELDRIVAILLALSLGGVALGGLLALVVSGRAVAPVRRLATVVDDVTSTRQLQRRVAVGGRDELSLLGAGVNRMLAAVEDAVSSQRRLVAEASHELRTPLTSLRADIGLLRRGDGLDPGERDEIVAGLDDRLAEMSDLVRELMELAEGDLEPPPFEPVRLDLVVDDAVERVRRRRPDALLDVSAGAATVQGAAPLLERAVANLLENAVKWSPRGGRVDVRVASDGTLTVRDRGPGIAPEHVPHVFERFYRSDRDDARAGFGLGLAIVQRIAESHGGIVAVEAPADGGSRFVLRIPLASAP